MRNANTAQQALKTVEEQITADMQVQVGNISAKLSVRPLDPKERPVVVDETGIGRALIATIPSLTQGFAITVNGRDIVGVADLNQAKAVKDGLLEEYRSTVLKDAAAVEVLKFQETIDWHPKLMRTENLRTVEEAQTILKYGTDKMAQYVVRSGDTGWDIARSYSVSPEQLAKSNPDVDLEVLQIGQTLNVTFKEPYVHTVSVSKRVAKEGIPFSEEIQNDPNLWPWQYAVVVPGVMGSRELTIRESRENGKVIRTDVVDSKVLSQPKQQSARQGTKQVPPMGSGQLAFPVVGVITSYYGDRPEGYHFGVDIGCSVGTPVLAADNGMVTFAGWDGNYGYAMHIDHGGGKMITWYAHLSAFAVSVGDTVKKGQVIAYSGNTGRSTGPHLHYEVHSNGVALNPLSFYK
ncbi:MAG TPA: peptidoglycan DD-metalloendopeptidase family protein [Symbiobacteriaceae bacterium]